MGLIYQASHRALHHPKVLTGSLLQGKGSRARSLGARFKLFYHGVDGERNGTGVTLKEEFVRNVLDVKRMSDFESEARD